MATSAVRDARNGEEFLDEARRLTGVEVRILDGDEEATFSYAGATSGLARTIDSRSSSTSAAARPNWR